MTLTLRVVCVACCGAALSRASTVTWYCPFSELSRLLATLRGWGHPIWLGLPRNPSSQHAQAPLMGTKELGMSSLHPLPVPLPCGRRAELGSAHTTQPPAQPGPMALLNAPSVDVLVSRGHHLEEVIKGPLVPIFLHKHHADDGENDGSCQPRVGIRGLRGPSMSAAQLGTDGRAQHPEVCTAPHLHSSHLQVHRRDFRDNDCGDRQYSWGALQLSMLQTPRPACPMAQ